LLGEPSRAHGVEHVFGSAKLAARVAPPFGASQPLAVEQVPAGQIDGRVAAPKLADRFNVGCISAIALLEQRLATGEYPKRPGRSRGPGAVRQGGKCTARYLRVVAADGGFDQHWQRHLSGEYRIAADDRQGGVDRLLAAAGEQLRHREDALSHPGRGALAPGGRLADLSQCGRARPGDLTTVGQQQAFGAAVDAEHPGGLAGGHQLAHLGPAVGGLIETAGHGVCHGAEDKGDGSLGEGAQRSGESEPPVGEVEQGLVVPQAPSGDGASLEPFEAGERFEVVGAQRLNRGAQ
jgi:hypothetical protein